ncbi:MAG: DUF3604 domain-containing protein [Chlamydiales bacterium]|nr:DUF3604 domain-containing protein [Chlamydiales bacterium]
MRRSICITEPKTVLAGQVSTVKFSYIPANNLPAKTLLKFEMLSKGRDIDWHIPQVNIKKHENVIWMQMPDQKMIGGTAQEDQYGVLSQFEFQLPAEIKAGDELSFFIGSPDLVAAKGTKVQQYIQRRRPFLLYIDPKGKGDYKEPEMFQLDIRGNLLHSIRVIAPSVVSKNERFDVIIRFEDAYGNLTGFCSEEDTLVELTYNQLRENLSWKLFVPETGFTTLPNLYFNEPGVYKFKLTNLKTKEVFYSDPIKCFQETEYHVNWGILHGESEKFDALENIESSLRSFRDDLAMQFFSTSPFESEQEVSNNEWKHISTQIADFNEPDRFVTFLGFQWAGIAKEEGLRQLIFFKDAKPILRLKDSKSNTLKKIYKGHTAKDFISIPCFTMGKETCFDFKDFSPEYERVVEIYNAWGSSECTEKEGNPRPIKKEGKKFFQEAKDGSIRDALNENKRFGFVAGGFDDRGVYSTFFESEQVQYSPGLTAILITEQTRDQLLLSLYNRKCYATTGKRIILDYKLAGQLMGSELNTTAKPGLAYNRHINLFIAGTAPLKEIAIIRNGETIKTYSTNETSFQGEYDDTDPFDKMGLKDPETGKLFVYYYIRVIQNDGHMAWSSPIWVDLKEDVSTLTKRTRKKG